MNTTYQVTFRTLSGQLLSRTVSAPPNNAELAVLKVNRQQLDTKNAVYEIIKVIENYRAEESE